VAIFEPIGPEADVAQQKAEELRLWQQVLKAYRAQSWDQAELALFNLQRLYPNAPLYALYTERVAYFRAHPPERRWEGVTTFEEK